MKVLEKTSRPAAPVFRTAAVLPLFFACFCLLSCSSPPETPEENPPVQTLPPVPGPEDVTEGPEPAVAVPAETEDIPQDDGDEVVAMVDSVAITKEAFNQTKSEIEIVVEDLNAITRKQDYARWLTYLDPEYRKMLSSRSWLAGVSRSLPRALQERHVRLYTLEDYFDYVFVPSRQNIRVDDIQFITPSRVYVIMEMAQGQRAAVYILEKNGNGSWKLVGKD